MCGIVGVIGDLNKPQKEVLQQLIYADTFRGSDSTGMVSVGYQNQARIFKKAVTGPDFLEFEKTQQYLNAKAVIAHNRWATKGKVNTTNAHPFSYGDFSGVHNGTLRGQYLLPDHADFTVDSENIYYAFDKIGVEETVEKLNGAYALVWHNAKEQTISFLRNSERPLHYCFSKDKKNVYYASEWKMLDWILDRNHIAREKIYPVGEHSLFTFKIPDVGKQVAAPSIRTLKHYKPAPATNVSRISTKRKLGELDKYLGKEIECQIGDTVQGGHYGRDYIKLLPLEDIVVGNLDIEVRVLDNRVFLALETARGAEKFVTVRLSHYADSSTIPKYIVGISDSIGIFDEPSEEEVLELDFKEGEEDEDATFQGYDGKDLNKAEWKKATAKGCCWCASPVVATEKNLFINEDEFLCEDCKTIPMVEDYLSTGGGL